jgi:hypothetical protein
MLAFVLCGGNEFEKPFGSITRRKPQPHFPVKPSPAGDAFANRSVSILLHSSRTSFSRRAMQLDAESPAISVEILVGGKDRHPSQMPDRTQQEIRVRTLYARGTVLIEETGSHLEIRRFQPQVRESPQLVPQSEILPFLANTGKQLLSDRPDHCHLEVGNQAREFLDNDRFQIRMTPPQRQRPNGSVDQYFQATLRCFL